MHWRLITFRTLLHLGPNVITFRTLLHLGQLLHLGLQQISSTRSVFFCGQITILFYGINFPGPTLNALQTRRPSCVNSKLCKLLKLVILLISRVEFFSWTMHTDAVVPLTGLSFNALYMSQAETTSWPSLQYLLIDALTDTKSCHISFPACGSE